jgi:hypothetical protein
MGGGAPSKKRFDDCFSIHCWTGLSALDALHL